MLWDSEEPDVPIVTIQIVASNNENTYSAECLAQLSDSLGSIFNSNAGGTWVKLEYLDRSHYAENETHPDENIQPTFVEVLKRTLPEQETLAREAEQIAAVVAHVLSRPLENVHIIYLPPGEGRVAFGGKLLKKQK
jgi:phenylpyruvate tautomerase PptA (4-oxalocrotonate tautomerase family)